MSDNTSSVTKLYIKELDLDLLSPNLNNYLNSEQGGLKTVIIGIPGSGKSTLIASLLYAKKHLIPCVMAVSGTEDSNEYYKKIIPDTFIFNKYDEVQLESFIKRQKIAKKHVSNPWAVCLLDDCTDTPGVFTKPLQQGIFKNSRHWKMWYILSLQYCMDVKPVIRTNISGTFILREPNLRNRRSLWENYCSIVPDFDMFCQIMDQISDDYTALYVHNASTSNKLEDCLFWYKATPPPKDFKFGADEIYDFHYSRYNPEYVNPVV
jgi:energy-coupling factor transporter ATP-binding protein EcfA2